MIRNASVRKKRWQRSRRISTESAMRSNSMTLTLRDVSHMLQISERTVRRYIASGKLRAVKIGREYRITIDEYDAFVSSS
jgi:excisionase family DNA binding protein